MKINFNDFLNLTKVIRMLYGVEVSTLFFEKNLEGYGFAKKDLHNLKSLDNIKLTLEDNK